jgi:hypothetical protein
MRAVPGRIKMKTVLGRRSHQQLAYAAAVMVLSACAQEPPLAPEGQLDLQPALTTLPGNAEFNTTIAELRRATARYHNVNAALADGFELVEECEERPGADPVGSVFANLDRLVDGVIDASHPEALFYEPGENGQMNLVGVELVVPADLWTEEDPPEFLGTPFEREDEFVFGLHIWIWRHNPNGLFAFGNPRVSCEVAA